MKIESQNKMILKYLKKDKSLTPLEALIKFGSLRLGARIYDLKKQGHNIGKKIVKSEGKHFASYYLIK